MNIMRDSNIDKILSNLSKNFTTPFYKIDKSKGIDNLKIDLVSEWNNIYDSIKWYFNSNAFDDIPEILIHKDNEYLVKNIVVRYFKHPVYWKLMNAYNRADTFEIYNVSSASMLKYAKTIIKQYNIDPNNTLFIRKQITRINNDGSRQTLQAKIGLNTDDKSFKEFKTNFQKRMKRKYTDKELIYYYISIMTDEELSNYTTEHKKLFDKGTKSNRKELLNAHKEAINYRKNNPFVAGQVQSNTNINTNANNEDNDEEYDEIEYNDPNNNLKVVQGHASVTSKIDRQLNSNTIDESKRGQFEYMVLGGYKTEEGNFANHNSKLLRKAFIDMFGKETSVAFSALFNTKEDLKQNELYPKVINSIADAIDLYRPNCIILTEDLLLELFTSEYNSSMTVYNSRNKIFTWKYDENFDGGYHPVVFTLPNPLKKVADTDEEISEIYEQSLRYIYSFIKQGNVNEAIIRSNQTDNSHLCETIFPKMSKWSEVIDMFKNGYELALVQSFYNEVTFKTPILLAQFKKDKEKLYFNCTDIPYVYYYCTKEIDLENSIGIDPIETSEYMVEKSVTMREFLTQPWGIGNKKDRPRYFESDISAVDKFTIYAKCEAMKAGLEYEDILHTNFDIFYLDIEVYSPFGFPKPEQARGEVVSFAYMSSLSDHVTITINAKGKDVEAEARILINGFLEKAELKLGKNEFKKLKDEVTFDIIEVQDEYNVFKDLERLIMQDKCELGTAWNAQFDFNYLINRAKLMGWDDISLSPFGIRGYNSYTDSLYRCVGVHNIDMLDTYKASKTRAPKSLKLGYISTEELGFTKIEYEGELFELYDNNKPLFAAYNIFDTILIKYLNQKTNLFGNLFALRQFQGASLASMSETIAPFNNLSIRKARQDNMFLRRTLRYERKTGQYEGAFTMTRSTIDRPKFVEGELTSRGSTSPLRYGITDFDQSLTYNQKVIIKRDDKILRVNIGDYEFVEGDETLTIDNKTKNPIFAKVNSKMIHKRKDPIYKIKLMDGSYVEGTAGHTAVVYRKYYDSFNVAKYERIECRMDEILQDDKIMTIKFNKGK